MSEPQPRFDDVIHARNRLQICAVLADVDALEFAVVEDVLEVSDYVVSKHVKVLAETGYVTSEKVRQRGRSHTWLSLTDLGRDAYLGHIAELRRITR